MIVDQLIAEKERAVPMTGAEVAAAYGALDAQAQSQVSQELRQVAEQTFPYFTRSEWGVRQPVRTGRAIRFGVLIRVARWNRDCRLDED